MAHPPQKDKCPGCLAELPVLDGPSHRYIGASPACWALYTGLTSGGEPPIAPFPLGGMLIDAYAAQHPGVPSDQAIQSVAVHLLALYGVLGRGVSPGDALWVRQRALREIKGVKHGRFQWLPPPSFAGKLTIADVVQAPTPQARARIGDDYVRQVFAIWSANYLKTIAAWYDQFVLPDRL